MTEQHIAECANWFDVPMDGEVVNVSQVQKLTTQRLMKLSDGIEAVTELLNAAVDSLPNSTDRDKPQAMLMGALAMQREQLGQLHALAAGTLQMMRSC